jgi:hypothetical protein
MRRRLDRRTSLTTAHAWEESRASATWALARGDERRCCRYTRRRRTPIGASDGSLVIKKNDRGGW